MRSLDLDKRQIEIEDECCKAAKFPRSQLLHSYINDNHVTCIFKNGTRVRATLDPEADRFTYRFAENCDVLITKWCDANCAYCHEGATIKGKHAELFKDNRLLPIFATWNPGSEIAIGGGNALAHPDIIEFAKQLTKLGAICNLTVNQKHIWDDKLELMIKEGYVKGIGISLTNPSSDADLNRIRYLKHLSHNNVVLHVIVGIVDETFIPVLTNHKVLFLGYKNNVGRGVSYNKQYESRIKANTEWLVKNLKDLSTKFQVMSFDNLALAQLDARKNLNISDEEWNLRFQGKDYGDPTGTEAPSTFYFDAVNQTIGRSSTQPYNERIKYSGQTFEEAFKASLSNYKVNENEYGELNYD